MVRGAALVACMALLLALGAADARAAPRRQDVPVQVRDTIFEPFSMTVQQGTIVTWSHLGRLTHTVTSDDGLFDSREMDTGATFSARFNAVGTFGYHCFFHGSPRSGMSGTVVVTPGDGGAPPLEPLQPPSEQPDGPAEPSDDGVPEAAAPEEPQPAEPPAEEAAEPEEAAQPEEAPAEPAVSEDWPVVLPEVGVALGPTRLLVALGLAALGVGIALRGRSKPPDD
jgi:plastocyanin